MPAKVLVVIPTYARPRMCRRAVDSLLAQKFTNWGLVIAKNNGSVLLEEYVISLGDTLDHLGMRMVTLPARGLAYALNSALGTFLAGFEYFAVLEDDDEWDRNFLSVMVRAANTSRADVTHCMQRQEPEKRQSNGAPMSPNYLRLRNWVNWPMCLFRASVYARLGSISDDVGPATDWDTHLRCVGMGMKYHFVPGTMVTHHWHGDNYCLLEDGKPAIFKKMERGVYG
jgi:glycosyltransferase involved in cell wall biosynthesis